MFVLLTLYSGILLTAPDVQKVMTELLIEMGFGIRPYIFTVTELVKINNSFL